MKIAIIGYSGSGKSTLAKMLAEHYGEPVLYLDTVHFLPGWVEREREEERAIVCEFLDKNGGWVIDGTYSKVEYERRMQEADKIVFLCFNRFVCLFRALKRSKTYKGRSRESMTVGCEERMPLRFVLWILWGGRMKKRRRKFERTKAEYSEKFFAFKNQRQLERYLRTEGVLR